MPSPMDSDSDSDHGHDRSSSSSSTASSSRSPLRTHGLAQATSSFTDIPYVDELDAADGRMDGRFFGHELRDSPYAAGGGSQHTYYDNYYESRGHVDTPQSSAAAMLDAADGVMDGKFFGAPIQSSGTFAHAEFSSGTGTRVNTTTSTRIHGGSGSGSGAGVREEVTIHRGEATVIQDRMPTNLKPRTLSEKVTSSRRIGERVVSSKVVQRVVGAERVISTQQVHSRRVPNSEREVSRRVIATQRIIQDKFDKTVDVPLDTVQERLVIKDKERVVKINNETLQVKEMEKVIYRDVKVPVEVKKEVLLRQEVKVPVYKTTEKIRRVPVERVIEKVVEQVIDKVKEVQVEKIRVEEVEVPFEVIVERIVEVPVPRLVEKVIHVPVERIVEKVTYVPVERVVEHIVHVPVERLIEQIVEVEVENVIEKIVEVEVPGTRVVKSREPRTVDDSVMVVDNYDTRRYRRESLTSSPLMLEREPPPLIMERGAVYAQERTPIVTRTPKRVIKV